MMAIEPSTWRFPGSFIYDDIRAATSWLLISLERRAGTRRRPHYLIFRSCVTHRNFHSHDRLLPILIYLQSVLKSRLASRDPPTKPDYPIGDLEVGSNPERSVNSRDITRDISPSAGSRRTRRGSCSDLLSSTLQSQSRRSASGSSNAGIIRGDKVLAAPAIQSISPIVLSVEAGYERRKRVLVNGRLCGGAISRGLFDMIHGQIYIERHYKPVYPANI